MRLDAGIRKHGFRKWYERELLQSHAHLALAFLCVIGVFAAVESAMGGRSWNDRAVDGFSTLFCAAAGLWALRRYVYLLMRAEAVAQQADCPGCQTYGRMEVMRADTLGEGVQVRCRHCSHVWHIDA